MAQVLRLPRRQPADQDVAALCARLRHLEAAESPDEATMDAISQAEQGVLAALAAIRSGTLAEVTLKLAVVARRANAAEGFMTEGESGLLRSALGDMGQFAAVAAVA
jgi:hypothetical protein